MNIYFHKHKNKVNATHATKNYNEKWNFFAVLTETITLQKQLERRAKKFHYGSITTSIAIIVQRKI